MSSAFIDLIKTMPPSNLIGYDSPLCSMMRAGGKCIVNTVTCTRNVGNADNYVNVFSFLRGFKLIGLYGIVSEACDNDDIDDFGFVVYDGANTVKLTDRDPGGLVVDNFGEGSIIAKVDDAAATAIGLNSDQVRVDETNEVRPLTSCIVGAKSGATNYLRLMYDSADAGLDMDIDVVLVYEDISDTYVSGLAIV